MPDSNLQNRVAALEQIVTNGALGGRLSLHNIVDLIPTVSTAPTHTPRSFIEQFRIYKNGSTYRFYWYDGATHEWRYATGT